MLKIENLHVSINNKNILKGINLKVKKGEIHAIMGPNGSGKSTLSTIIAGKKDYSIKKGKIIFDKKNILNLSPEKISHLGVFISFQYPIEIPGISTINFIRTSINESREANGLPKMSAFKMLKKIHEKAKILKIDKNLLYRELNVGLSGGEKKKNEILQMLMLEPKLCVLDETDSGLDIDALKTVSKGINSMKNKNNSIIIITHYQRILEYIIPDNVHIVYDGKIIKSGSKNLAYKLEKKGYDWIKKELKQNI